MMFNILIPVHVWRVPYQVATGRPCSKFEMLLLESVASGKTTLAALREEFRIHPRLIIEGLATLFHAGWIALDANNQLLRVRTQSEADDKPPAELVLTEESEELVQERVTGQLLRTQWVKYRPVYSLQGPERDGRVMPAGDLPPRLEPGQCHPFLMVQSPSEQARSYVRWIGDPELVRAGVDVVVVSVDPERGQIRSLPRAWLPGLQQRLIELAQALPGDDRRRRMAEGPAIEPQYDPKPTAYFEGFCNPSGVSLLDSQDGASWGLSHELRTLTKGSYLLILSRTLSMDAVRKLEPALSEALRQGVIIDLLWGEEPPGGAAAESHRDALALLQQLAWEAKRELSAGSMRVSQRASEVRANLLVTHQQDQSAGSCWQVTWGAAAWLGSDDLGAALAITSAGPLAALCRILQDVVTADALLSEGTAPMRLANATEALSERARSEPPPPEPVPVRLWLDHQHETLRRFTARAEERNGCWQDGARRLLTSYDFSSSAVQRRPTSRSYAVDLGIELEEVVRK